MSAFASCAMPRGRRMPRAREPAAGRDFFRETVSNIGMRAGTEGIWASLAVLTAAALALAGPVRAQDAGTGTAGAEEPAQGQADGGTDAGPAAEATAEDGAAGPEAADGAPEDAAGEDTAESGEDGPLVVEAEDGSVLDDQTYSGEDDDFIPSQEIPVDEPIPFPSDI